MKLLENLASSRATPEFVAAVKQFVNERRGNPRVDFSPGAPPVKVERTLTQVLEAYPEAAIQSVSISGQSGCEFFRGNVVIRLPDSETRVDFYWDCRWKAEQMGWKDYFGYPDQIRAARELGHDCFRIWDEDSVNAALQSVEV